MRRGKCKQLQIEMAQMRKGPLKQGDPLIPFLSIIAAEWWADLVAKTGAECFKSLKVNEKHQISVNKF